MNRLISWLTAFFQADDSQSKWRRILGFGVIVGSLAVLYQADLADRSATAAAFVLAGASLFTGVLLGFLFGIPKTLQRKIEPGSSASLVVGDYQPNTNLEEISDWLTKMLVGVGLVQLGRVPDALESLGRYWEVSLGAKGSQPFAAGLVVYFGVIGFLLGYLWTRLALVGDFIEKDPRRLIAAVLQNIAAAAQRDPGLTERSPDRQVITDEQLEAAQRLQSVSSSAGLTLDHMRQQVRALATQYEAVRAAMSSGPERTRKLEVIASQMRAFSLAAYPLLSEFVQSQSPGDQLAAIVFLQTRPNKDYFRWLGERMHRDEQPFIAYHAGVALLNAARNATPAEREILYGVISRALEETSHLNESADRRMVLKSAMNALRRE
ncbi:MAG TPA: hypothetical protein VGC13_03700 [Longimicrobium sp.]|uniref:hypothetical protein n=1 Tax=Longimicrobium sp. TaxID=2029185 RepID=UPI002EDB134E